MSRTETIINGNLSKLILKNGNLPFILFLEDVIDQSGLSSSEKSSNHCDGSKGAIVVGHGVEKVLWGLFGAWRDRNVTNEWTDFTGK